MSTTMKQILIVGSQHGNETLGDALYEYINRSMKHVLHQVDFIIANPEAHAIGVRLIATDMNRSYVRNPYTYEEKMAQKLLRQITEKKYDLVLDLHTTTCDQPPCFIVNDMGNNDVRQFMAVSHIDMIVHMKTSMVTRSLIGVVANAVSIEINQECIEDSLLQKLATDLAVYLSGINTHSLNNMYTVDAVIAKDDMHPEPLENFVYNAAGFYPVLAGEQSYSRYTDYLGFKASKKYTIRL